MNRRKFLAGLIPAIPLLGAGLVLSTKENPKFPSKVELSTEDGGTGKVELVRDSEGKLYLNLCVQDSKEYFPHIIDTSYPVKRSSMRIYSPSNWML